MTVNARNVTLNDETNIDSVPSAYPAMPLKRRCCLAITSKPAMINIVIDSSAAHHRLTFANSASSTSPININCAAQRTAATTRVRECPAPVNQLDAASRTMSDAARARSNALSRIMSISGLTPSAAWRLQLPARHANDPTGDSCRLRDIVAYPQRTGMVYLKVIDDHRFHPAAVNFVQVRRRFIQQQHLRSIAQQPRERQPLALAAGEARHLPGEGLGTKPQRRDHRGTVLAEMHACRISPPLTFRRQQPHAAAPLGRRQVPAALACDAHVAADAIHIRHRAQEQCFARARYPLQEHAFQSVQGQRNRAEVRTAQIFNFQHTEPPPLTSELHLLSQT